MDKTQNIDAGELLARVMDANSAGTLLLVGLGIAVWLVGGNVLVALHYRRLGKSPWSGFKPLAFPFKQFNASEWVALAALGVTSLVLFAFALGWR